MRELLSREVIEGLGHDTPFFLFSREKIRRALGQFRKCFPGAAIHYAMKANSDPGVLRTVYDAGGGFEVASAHELQLLRPMRVPPERIIYGTTIKPQAHIRTLFQYGVDRFAFDSFPELDKIAAAAPGAATRSATGWP
jgi:ornithine decarboxylase